MIEFGITGVCRDSRKTTTHVGGDGWHLTEEQAIRLIAAGAASFHVESRDRPRVVVRPSLNGGQHLQTVGNNNPGDNLDNLPRLPYCQG